MGCVGSKDGQAKKTGPKREEVRSGAREPDVAPLDNRVESEQAAAKEEEEERYPGYAVGRAIGRGAYARVWEAEHKKTGTLVAIKHQFDLLDDLTTYKRALREISILRILQHPSVVRLYDVFVPGGGTSVESEICLVFELAATSMDKVIRSAFMLEEEQVRQIMYNLVTGLHYIHSAGVLHRDLKPGNILVYNDCSVRICDFGLARTVPSFSRKFCPISHSNSFRSGLELVKMSSGPLAKAPSITRLTDANKRMTMHVTTRWYRAPEIICQQESYGAGVDVWAVGCIFAELLSIVKGSLEHPGRRQALFPGKSCLVLSPRETEESAPTSSISKRESESDQLAVIASVLGNPQPGDLESISDKDIAEFIEGLPKFERVNFAEKYPKASSESIDLLDQMLVFNPAKRIGIAECMKHPYFDSVRDQAKEMSAASRLSLEVDQNPRLKFEELLGLFRVELRHFAEANRGAGLIPSSHPSE